MRVLPSSSSEWLSLLLFPFKAYPIVAFFVVITWGGFLPRQSFQSGTPLIDTLTLVVGGYYISIAVLAFAGLFQLICARFAAAFSCFGFGIAAIVLFFNLAPHFCAA